MVSERQAIIDDFDESFTIAPLNDSIGNQVNVINSTKKGKFLKNIQKYEYYEVGQIEETINTFRGLDFGKIEASEFGNSINFNDQSLERW